MKASPRNKVPPQRTLDSVTDEEIKAATPLVTSLAAASRFLGLSQEPKAINRLLVRIRAIGADIRHFSRSRVEGVPATSIFTVKERPPTPAWLLRRLVELDIKPHECEKCHIGPEWQGQPLRLRLLFKNDDRRDARIENLSILCPNCLDQTAPSTARKVAKIRKENAQKQRYEALLQEEIQD